MPMILSLVRARHAWAAELSRCSTIAVFLTIAAKADAAATPRVRRRIRPSKVSRRPSDPGGDLAQRRGGKGKAQPLSLAPASRVG
jgi:hypothetical protein